MKEDVVYDIPPYEDYIFRIRSSSFDNYRLYELESHYTSYFTKKNKNILTHMTIYGYYDKDTETFVPRSHYNQHLMRSLGNMIQDAMFSFRQEVQQVPQEKEITPPPGFEKKEVVQEQTNVEAQTELAKTVAQEIMKKKRTRSPRRTPSPKTVQV